jgi:hypothetical protein
MYIAFLNCFLLHYMTSNSDSSSRIHIRDIGTLRQPPPIQRNGQFIDLGDRRRAQWIETLPALLVSIGDQDLDLTTVTYICIRSSSALLALFPSWLSSPNTK